MLEYGGVSYENRTMLMPKPEWLQYKHSLGFDFPNLPYYQVINYAFIEKTFLYKLLGGWPEIDPPHGNHEALGQEDEAGGEHRGGVCHGRYGDGPVTRLHRQHHWPLLQPKLFSGIAPAMGECYR